MSSHFDSNASSFIVQGWFGPSWVSLRTQNMLEDMCHISHATGMALGHPNDFILCCSNRVWIQGDSALLCHVKSPAWTASCYPDLLLAPPSTSSRCLFLAAILCLCLPIRKGIGPRAPCNTNLALCGGYKWLSQHRQDHAHPQPSLSAGSSHHSDHALLSGWLCRRHEQFLRTKEVGPCGERWDGVEHIVVQRGTWQHREYCLCWTMAGGGVTWQSCTGKEPAGGWQRGEQHVIIP